MARTPPARTIPSLCRPHRLVAAAALLSAAVILPAQDGSPSLDDLRAALRTPADPPDRLVSSLGRPLDRARADALSATVFEAWREVARSTLVEDVPPLPPNLEGGPPASPLESWTIGLGEHQMPFHLIRKENDAVPEGGRALFVCMHGGGQNRDAEGPHAWKINAREWQAQTMLAARVYPTEGLFVVPRMADDRLGRWWHAHNQEAFDRLIELGIAAWGVDPDRVFVLGISEGGYGTDILAPFMADRFAGADAMAAGVHVHDNPPENLRNLAFRTDIGADDTTYDRVGLARTFHARLDALRDAAGESYDHVLAEQEGKGHGIDYRPGVAWLKDKVRDPWPATVTWTSRTLHGRRRPAFYWLGLDAADHQHAIRLEAHLDRGANSVRITAVEDSGKATRTEPFPENRPLQGATLRVMLRDELLDLDRPIVVEVNGEVRFEGTTPRTLGSLITTMALRGDPRLVFSAVIEIELAIEGG